MPGKSPALFLSQIIDLESNEIPSLPWCYSAVPFISSGLRWHSASMLSSAAKSRGEMSWNTSKSLKTERFGWYARETPGDLKRGSLGFLGWTESHRHSVSLFLDLNLPRHFQTVPMEMSAFCLLVFNLNLTNFIQWFDICLRNFHTDLWAGKQICVDYVGPVKLITWNSSKENRKMYINVLIIDVKSLSTPFLKSNFKLEYSKSVEVLLILPSLSTSRQSYKKISLQGRIPW